MPLETNGKYSVDIVIDAGNTKVKVGVWENDTLSTIMSISYDEVHTALRDFCRENDVRYAIVCSVGPTIDWERLMQCKKLLKLSVKMPLGISNADTMPAEVGEDRIAVVAGTALSFPGEAVLIIDAGTCVTYDFIDREGVFTCGNISPGLQMRLNAMHHYTSALPQLTYAEPVGDSTIDRVTTPTCMRGGAIDGMVGEIEYIVSLYRETHGDFKIILTGGDTDHLAKRLKSRIFARPNYLLESLYTILKHNIKICES